MDFWNTVRGVELAETLIRELPKLTREKEQIVVCEGKIKERIESGYRFVGTFRENGIAYAILEK